MLRILRNKFICLGRDEDGVALVTTLAVFMFMYLVCMGVYAVGTAVKTRIHLQNACDAAAYSAAVVQADTLSRIATINRAMAWTYITMTRRQMDYIVYRWLKETCAHYNDDMSRAQQYTIEHHECTDCVSPYCPDAHLGICISKGVGWDISNIKLNDKGGYSESFLRSEYTSGLPNNMSNWSPSFYSQSTTLSGLENQIEDDLLTIREMNDKIEKLMNDMPGKLDEVAREIGEANYPELDWRRNCRVFQEERPLEGYMAVLNNTANDEKRFISFSDGAFRNHFRNNGTVASPTVFDKGINDWFVLGDGEHSEGGEGIHRSYNHKDSGDGTPLKATWWWWSKGWKCGVDSEGRHWMLENGYHANASQCDHGHGSLCECKNGSGNRIEAVCYADNSICYESRGGDLAYKGKLGDRAIYARPRVLTQDYFGKNGTITVAVAVENRNPWASVLGTAIRGIFSAFNIGGNIHPLYTVCFASAKAGYKNTLNWNNTSDIENDRAYHVDWQNEEEWNLCQSDWDAVLIPVRRAESPAVNGSWGDGNVGFLDSYARQIGVHSTNMRAGGTKEMTLAQWRDGNGRNLPPDYYRFGRVGGRGGWRELPDGRTWDWESGAVNTEWQIEKKSQPIDFNNLQRVMFH